MEYDKKVEALYDPFVFAKLIGYYSQFEWLDFHYELFDFYTSELKHRCFTTKPDLSKVDFSSSYRLSKVPREHQKTTLLGLLFLWRIYRTPMIRMLLGSYDFEPTRGTLRLVKAFLDDIYLKENLWNDRPHYPGVPLVPDLNKRVKVTGANEAVSQQVVWTQDKIQVNRTNPDREPTLDTITVGSLQTSFHYDFVVLDDIVTLVNSKTMNGRNKVTRWAEEIVSLTSKPYVVEVGDPETGLSWFEVMGKNRLVVGTPYYKKDYYEQLENIQKKTFGNLWVNFEKNIYKNGKDNTDGYILEPVFNEAVEEDIRTSMEFSTFSAQYLLQTVEESTGTLDVTNVAYIMPTDVLHKNDMYTLVECNYRSHFFRPVLSIDPAISLSSKANYTAIVVGGVSQYKSCVLLDAWMKRATQSQQVAEIFAMFKKYPIASVTIDCSDKLGISLIQLIRETWAKDSSLPRFRIIEHISKVDKLADIEATLTPYLEDKEGLIVPLWFTARKEMWEQLEFFPSQYDDFPDAIKQLIKCSKPFSIEAAKKYAEQTRLSPIWERIPVGIPIQQSSVQSPTYGVFGGIN